MLVYIENVHIYRLACVFVVNVFVFLRGSYFSDVLLFQGVVTAAISLITCLSQKNPDEFKTCVSLAVSRLSRVRVCVCMHETFISKTLKNVFLTYSAL